MARNQKVNLVDDVHGGTPPVDPGRGAEGLIQPKVKRKGMVKGAPSSDNHLDKELIEENERLSFLQKLFKSRNKNA